MLLLFMALPGENDVLCEWGVGDEEQRKRERISLLKAEFGAPNLVNCLHTPPI